MKKLILFMLLVLAACTQGAGNLYILSSVADNASSIEATK